MSSQGFSLNDARVATAASLYLRQYVPLIGPASADKARSSPSWRDCKTGHRWNNLVRISMGLTPGRASIVTALLAGCIPVLFVPEQDRLWPLHWGGWREASRVMLDMHRATADPSYSRILFPPSERGPSAPVPSIVYENWAGVDMMDHLHGRRHRQSLVYFGEPQGIAI
jgi:hypothetical protein